MCPSYLLYGCAWAVADMYHRPLVSTTEINFFTVVETGESRIKVLAGLVCSEASLLGCLLPMTSHGLLCIYVLVASSYMDASHAGLETTNLMTSVKTLSPNYSHILGSQEL